MQRRISHSPYIFALQVRQLNALQSGQYQHAANFVALMAAVFHGVSFVMEKGTVSRRETAQSEMMRKTAQQVCFPLTQSIVCFLRIQANFVSIVYLRFEATPQPLLR